MSDASKTPETKTPETPETTSHGGKPRGRGLGWPIGMGVILGGTVVLNLFVMRVAGSDPSFAVEPDYYQKAVRYDDVMAERRHNAELGWRLEPALAQADGEGALLSVRLADSAGRPLTGATMSVEAFPVARSTEVVRATLVADEAGDGYEARLPVRRAGQWELRFTAARGGERFTSVERIEVAR